MFIQKQIPWIEKYKPKSLTSFNDNNFLNDKLVNNCILYGKSGVGKTTYTNILIDSIYDDNGKKQNVIKLNASDERGIETVRKKIKTFAKQMVQGDYDFKIIVLDEADTLTNEAQTALRRVIEVHSNSTRFIFICNYIDNIIEPIKSRCHMIKFNKFSNDYIKTYLNDILVKENIEESKRKYLVDTTLHFSKNDLRKSINLLEVMVGINNLENYSLEDLSYIFGIITTNKLQSLLEGVKSINDINDCLNDLCNYKITNILLKIQDIVVNNKEIEDSRKIKFLILLAEIDNIKNKNIDKRVILTKLLMEYIYI